VKATIPLVDDMLKLAPALERFQSHARLSCLWPPSLSAAPSAAAGKPVVARAA
jgi:hypothetical protein